MKKRTHDPASDSLLQSGEPARRHLQKRLATFLLIMTLFVGLSFAVVSVATAIVKPEVFWSVTLRLDRLVHFGETLLLTACWLVCRFRTWSVAGLRFIDAFATISICLLFALDLGSNPASVRPEQTLVIITSNLLTVRAALVPSTTGRSLLFALIAAAAALVAT